MFFLFPASNTSLLLPLVGLTVSFGLTPTKRRTQFSGNSPTLEAREGTELGYLHPTSEDPGLREGVVSWHQVLEKPSGTWKLVGASDVGDPWLWWGQWS